MSRKPCCVPFCRRTTKRTDCTEWVCGKHWRSVDAGRRRSYAALNRSYRRAIARGDWPEVRRINGEGYIMWGELKAEAIEAAVGLR